MWFSKKVKIRQFKTEDAVEVARLHRLTIRHVCSSDYSDNIIDSWATTTAQDHRESISQKAGKYVAILDKKIVGFGDFTSQGEITGIYVDKDYQGQGVGSKLLTKIEHSAHKMGIKKIMLESTITALNFYKRRNYTVVKQSMHSFGDYKGITYIMEKEL